MMPLHSAGGRRARRRRRHVRRRWAAVVTRPRSTSTTSRRRSASPPTAGSGSRCCSPAAVERIERIAASGRWMPGVPRPADRAREQPPRPDLQHAGAGHAVPARSSSCAGCSTRAGSTWCVDRCQQSADILYGWAEERPCATPFVVDAAQAVDGRRHDRPRRRRRAARSPPCCGTTAIVDTDSYRKLGRNQMRIGMFPAVDPDDVDALTRCIDHVVAELLRERRAHLAGDAGARSARPGDGVHRVVRHRRGARPPPFVTWAGTRASSWPPSTPMDSSTSPPAGPTVALEDGVRVVSWPRNEFRRGPSSAPS